MNTLGTTVAAPRRQAESLALRPSADPAELQEGTPDLFGAVLGALTEPAIPEDAVSPGGGRSMSGTATEASLPGQAADPIALLVAVAGAASRPAGNGPATARDPVLALVARALPGAETQPQAGPPRSASGIAQPSETSPNVSAETDSSASDDSVATARPSHSELLDPAPAASAPVPAAPQAPPSAIPAPPLRADEPLPPGDTTAARPEELPVPRPAAEAAQPARIIETVSEPRPRIVVLAQETHFAPIAPRLARSAADGTDTVTIIPRVPGTTVPPSVRPARPAATEPVTATPAAGKPGLDPIPAARSDATVAAYAPVDPPVDGAPLPGPAPALTETGRTPLRSDAAASSTVSPSGPALGALAKPVAAEVTPSLDAAASTAPEANGPAAPHMREVGPATAASEADAPERPATQTARPISPESATSPEPAPGLRDASQAGAASAALPQSAVAPAASRPGPIGPVVPDGSGFATVPRALPSDAAVPMPPPIPDGRGADIASPARSDRNAAHPDSLAPVAERVATPQPASARPSTDAGVGLPAESRPLRTDPALPVAVIAGSALASPKLAASDPASGPSPVQPASSATVRDDAATPVSTSFTEEAPTVPSLGRELVTPPASGTAPNRITVQDGLDAVSHPRGSDALRPVRPMEPSEPASVPEEPSTEPAVHLAEVSIPPVRPGTPAMPAAPHAGAPGRDLASVIDATVPTLPIVSSMTREAAAPVGAAVTGAESPLAPHPGPTTSGGDEPAEAASASPARSVAPSTAPIPQSAETPSITPLTAEGTMRADRAPPPEARPTPADPISAPRIDAPVEEASPPDSSAPAPVPRENALSGTARPADTVAERTQAPAMALTPESAEAGRSGSKSVAPVKAAGEAVRVEPAQIEPPALPAQAGAPVAGPARHIAEAVTAALPPPPAAAQPKATSRRDAPTEPASASPARSVAPSIAPIPRSAEAPPIAPFMAEGTMRAARAAPPEARPTPADPLDAPVEEASPPDPSAPAPVPRENARPGTARPADTLVERTQAPAMAVTPESAEADHSGSKSDAPLKAAGEAVRVEPARMEPLALPVQPGAPVAGPVRQIAEAVTAALPPPPAAAQPNRTGAEGPLRILTLQLRPMDLGTVLVRMRLRDGQLELNLRASREETAALLRQDGELLAGLLRGAGYQADGVTIGPGGQEPFSPTGTGSGLPSSDGQSPPQGRPQSSEPERRPASARTAESQDTKDWTNETNPTDPGRHDVYL